MKKKKKYSNEQTSDLSDVLLYPHQNESDEEILENITMLKEENLALKKLLDNLNSTLSKIKA